MAVNKYQKLKAKDPKKLTETEKRTLEHTEIALKVSVIVLALIALFTAYQLIKHIFA